MTIFTKIRKDEFVYNDNIVRMTKSREKLIKELDYRHFQTGRFAV